MTNISLDDAMFLLGESAGRPAHVIALQLFNPPPSSGADYTTTAYADLIAHEDIKAVFRKRPRRKLTSKSTLEWVDDVQDPPRACRRHLVGRPRARGALGRS